MTTTATPSLPGDWVPSVQANCLKTSDTWLWDYGPADNRWTVVGGPYQTTQCLPTSWNSAMTYTGTRCPPRYSEPCPNHPDGDPVTCCPTMGASTTFTCAASSDLSLADGSIFRCVSQYATNGTAIVTRTYMAASGPSSDVSRQIYGTGQHLYALAIIYTSPTEVSA